MEIHTTLVALYVPTGLCGDQLFGPGPTYTKLRPGTLAADTLDGPLAEEGAEMFENCTQYSPFAVCLSK